MECETFFPPAVIGGLIVGIFALTGVFLTHIAQNRRDKKRQQEVIQGVLQAIYEELSQFWERQTKDTERFWEISEGKILFNAHFEPVVNNFIIYNSNANYIGQIPDSELRRKIVRVYMLLDILISGHKMNNRLLYEYYEATDAGKLGPAMSIYEQRKFLGKEMRKEYDYIDKLVKNILEILQKEYDVSHLSSNSM